MTRKLFLIVCLTGLLQCYKNDISRGYDNLEHGDYERAIVCFNKAIDMMPNNYRARAGLGKALYQKLADGRGDSTLWHSCILNFSAAQDLQPKHNYSLIKSAVYVEWSKQLLTEYKDSIAALKILTKAISADPANPRLINQAAVLYYHYGNYQQALSLFRAAISIDSSLSEPFFNAAMIFWTLRQYDSCRTYIDKSMEINKDDDDLRYWKQRVDDKLGSSGLHD